MYYLGLDLGQRRDHTAIALLEKALRGPGLNVRGLERVPLGTTYPRVVDRVREIVTGGWVRGQCCVVVDGTGVGAAVMDMLRAARMGCEICDVTITSGERSQQSMAGNGQRWSVPKRDLLAAVQVPLERGELKIAKRLREAGALVRELMDVRATERASGRVRLGADGCGQHDDLVIAVALACWRARRGQVGPKDAGRLNGM